MRVEAEHVPTGDVTHTCTAYLTMVALARTRSPYRCPPSSRRLPSTSGTTAKANHRREVRLTSPGD